MSSETTRRRRLFATIGARLTLWGTGTVLVVCLLVCVILYVNMYYSLLQEVDGFIRGEVQELTAVVRAHPHDYRSAERAIRLELGSRVRGDLSFRLLDPNGRVLVSSDPRDPLAGRMVLPEDGGRANEQPLFETVRTPAKPCPVRVCSFPLRQPDGSILVAQVGYLLDQMTQSLAALRRSCGVALALATVLALAAGRTMARRSLQPVDRMTAKAKRIGAGRLGQRLPRSGTGDELDRLAETLNDMLARIETHVKRMQQFTADASHELRSPLAALRGSAEVALTRARSAGELRNVIEESIEHYDRLGRVAEDLLLLARMDAGENILRPEQLRLDRAVRDAVDLYAPLAADRNIDLALGNLDEIRLSADGARLRQVVGNLIDNAIKYTQESGRIRVSLAATDGNARIVVSDTGIGISSNDIPRVFDRFYRADRSRSSQGASSAGLGLSICRSIVEAHGGRITIESTPGQGTTVTVLLPLQSDHTGTSVS
jgi:heavy metal sensor kinase